MALINKPPSGAVDQGAVGEQNPGWPPFFSATFNILNSMTRSGTTAQRPTNKDFRWIGMPYYDLTLGYPVYLQSTGPDVWHNGAGASV